MIIGIVIPFRYELFRILPVVSRMMENINRNKHLGSLNKLESVNIAGLPTVT